MFKVSFKETKNNPSTTVSIVGGITSVFLRGRVELPEFWKCIPESIMQWIGERKTVEIYENLADNSLIIYSKGVSRCHEEDKYDMVLGQRLAEARAKYQIYKFFYNLTCRLYDYYSKILFGEIEIADNGKGSCLAQDIGKYQALCIREAHHIGELLKSKENE